MLAGTPEADFAAPVVAPGSSPTAAAGAHEGSCHSGNGHASIPSIDHVGSSFSSVADDLMRSGLRGASTSCVLPPDADLWDTAAASGMASGSARQRDDLPPLSLPLLQERGGRWTWPEGLIFSQAKLLFRLTSLPANPRTCGNIDGCAFPGIT